MIGQSVGPYQIAAKVGAGGMGEVYRARDAKLDRDVALKILPPEFANDAERVARFLREAKTLAAINHPHIAQLYGLEEGSGTRALVMELVDGEDLSQRIKHGAVPIEEALPIARQIAEALEAAHDAGIIHRDLKPANIKVRPDGTVKVLDFGLAKPVQDPRTPGPQDLSQSPTITSPAMTLRGVILGTAAYMAPEQAKGKAVDRRADIWAFGCVLYEMLTGRRAFDGEDTTEILGAIVKTEPDWSRLPASMPRSISVLLRRCLEKSVNRRLPHIGAARLELDDVNVGEPATAIAAPSPNRGRYLTAGALAGAAVVALTMALVSPASSPDGSRTAMHVAIPMPSPTTAANGVSLSPDGRYLATRGSGGESMLHTFDGSPPRSLDGVAGCWSPDSRSLVLLRGNGDLVRMDVAGGPAVAFGRSSMTGVGCAWGGSGVVLAGGGAEAFSHFTIRDGTTTALELDDGGKETQRFAPRFLPDGRRFVYLTVTPDGQRTVRGGSLDSRETTRIVQSDAPAVYSAGYLLFHRGGTLVAQPLDERTLTLSGEPQAISTEAAPGGVITIASFDASDTGMLVFSTTNGGVRAAQNWVDRRGNVAGTLPLLDNGEWLNLAVSPDGMRVAGTRMDRATGNWDLWSIDLRSGTPTRLTRQPGVDSDPVWSPDGTELAYVSRRADAPGIYRQSLANGAERLLLKLGPNIAGANDTRPTDWTPDGRHLVYTANFNIMALPLDKPADPIPIVATDALERNSDVSPDGRWIAFQSDDSGSYRSTCSRFQGPARKCAYRPRPLTIRGGAVMAGNCSGPPIIQTETLLPLCFQRN